MGNSPSEYHGATCKCGKRLPPCKSFDGFKQEYIDRKVDRVKVYTFLGGRYYRIEGKPTYYCPECFWKPKRDYIQKQQQEEHRRAVEAKERQRQMEILAIQRQEQLRKERELQIQREKEQRERERQRLAELARREQEAKEEAMRKEALRREEQRRMEERKRRQRLAEEKRKQQQAQFEQQLSQKRNLAQRFEAWVLKNASKNVHQNVHIESYQPFKNSTTLSNTTDIQARQISKHLPEDGPVSDDESDELCVWSEVDQEADMESDEPWSEDREENDTEIMETVMATISDMEPADNIDSKWLKSVQAYLIYQYAQINNFSELEVEILLESFSCVQSQLDNKECLYLTKILCLLGTSYLSDIPFAFGDDLPGRFLSMLLYSGRLQYANKNCMRQCLNTLVYAKIQDEQLQRMIVEASCAFWSTYDFFCFLQKCKEKCLSVSEQKHILHLIQTYSIKPDVVEDTFRGHQSDIIPFLNDQIENEPEKHLKDIVNEIRHTKLVGENVLDQTEKIVTEVNNILDQKNFHIKLDCDIYLTESKHKAKSVLKQLNSDSSLNIEMVANAIMTLMCAVQTTKHYCPRQTQVVALTILMLSSKTSTSRLLEVLTGEGKSCIVAMFAAVLGIQGKHVDIITSSPILACRDAEEWADFYEIFGLKATHNSDIKHVSSDENDPDEERRTCYKHDIVYGTVNDFSADILHEEFEQKQVRCGRRFDAVVIDEVDLLMLDEGVQFTYLSHNAAVLHHMEPVLATVWTVIGQYRPATTVYGSVLYTGNPKLFIDTIFESIDTAKCEVEDSSQFIDIAQACGLISDELWKMLMDENQESKKEAMGLITIDTIVALLDQLDDYLPYVFEAYLINEEGLLEPVNTKQIVSEGEEKVNILVLGNGIACTLNTQEELRDGAKAKVESSLQFSREEGGAEVKLPHFLKEFVMDQIPTYVENAIRSLQMVEDREYSISKDGKIIPVDFQNSGMMEMNKKWGGGLQQMLEMKHNLRLSSMSVVTNFMSNIELFSRYKERGGIYGLSGTLGLDSPSTARVLLDLFDVHVCSIPTHRQRKLYEKPAVIVKGGKDEWFEEITDVINEAIRKEAWKEGRAVLVLCEDIKTADELRMHVLEKKKLKKEKVHLYVHSDSNELESIDHEFSPGEIVIATNLAGRGTDIKINDKVNKSGGLLCLVTFLPRNRRVELQAFGRTGRKGEPGSVQCILKALSLPHHYQDLDIQTIRKLRAQEEQLRLDGLMNTDVKEVQLRETLFKKHCKFLQQIHEMAGQREDRSIAVNSLNESWGQWLQMKSDQIERLEKDKLMAYLSRAQREWQPTIPSNSKELVYLPVTNFYHLIKFGNQLLIKQEKENAESAYRYYTESIEMESRYAMIAYYNRAYCTIVMRKKGYMDKAIHDLNAAKKCLDPYIKEVMNALSCVSVVSQLRGSKTEVRGHNKDDDANDFATQMQVRIQILGFIRAKIEEAVKRIEDLKRSGDDAEAKVLGVFSLVPDADYITNQELSAMWNLGMEVIYSIEKKPKFCWSALIVTILGVAQIAAGVLLTVFTVGTAASVGMTLISEGISDCIDGIVGMATGEFSWTEYAISKATGLAISLATGGIARFATKGVKVARIGYKVARQYKELKAIPKIAKNSWGLAAKTNAKNAVKYVGKEVAQEVVMRGVSHVEDKLVEKALADIGKKCKNNLMCEGGLEKAFTEGNLGEIVDKNFIQKLPDSYISSDEMSPGIRKQAHDFFTNVCDTAVGTLVSSSEVKERLTSASLSLFSQLSEKFKSKKRSKMALVCTTVEVSIMAGIVKKAMEDLKCLTERFIPETQKVIIQFESSVSTADQTGITRHHHLKCAIKLKKELADHVGTIYGDAVTALLKQKLGSVINHGLNRTVNNVGRQVLSKHAFRTEKTLDDIKAGQNANYLRSVEVTPSGSSNRTMVSNYAKHVENEKNPGSLLELRVAVEHYGQGVTIYHQKENGECVRHCSIDPSSKKGGANIELVYVPPPDKHTVGHYDVLIKGKVVKVDSDSSNCLFQAFAHGQNPHLTSHEQKQQASKLRQIVAENIKKQPNLWNDHIAHRVEMGHLRKGSHFAMIGAGPTNPLTKIGRSLFQEAFKGNVLSTRYVQYNGVACTANRFYIPIGDSKRLERINTHMSGLSIHDNKNKRSWDTKPVMGMIKRHEGKQQDSEVSSHLVPSRAGANAGEKYANSVMTSPYHNHLEAKFWSPSVLNCIGTGKFSMAVEVKTGPLVPKDRDQFFKDMDKARESQNREKLDEASKDKVIKRLTLIQDIEPNAYRVEEHSAKLTIPLKNEQETPCMQSLLDDIEHANGKNSLQVTTAKDEKNITLTYCLPTDYDIFVPRDCTKLNEKGELHDGEITEAKRKVPNMNVGVPPKYKTDQGEPSEELKDMFKKLTMPTGKVTTEDKVQPGADLVTSRKRKPK